MPRSKPEQLYYGQHPDPKVAQELRLLWTHIHTVTAQAQATADKATRHATALQALLDKANRPASVTAPPPGAGPTDSILLGLPVTPIDANTLATGAALKFNKAKGTLEFS
jgi:hypothetical protein